MKVLLATDGSSASREAEWFLCRVSFPRPVELTLATVVAVPRLATMRREFPASISELLDEYHAKATAMLDAEAQRFEGIDGSVQTRVLSGHPADEIIQAAGEMHSDLIVLGARGRTAAERFLLGSVSQKVARYAPCSVLVMRSTGFAQAPDRPLKIIVAHDGSASSQNAVRLMASIPWGEGVEIAVVSVMTVAMHFGMEIYQKTEPLYKQERAEAQEALAWAVDQFKRSTPNVCSELCEGESAADQIVGVAERMPADIIVTGDRGRSRLEKFLLGSASQGVLAHAPCSVWIVREQRS